MHVLKLTVFLSVRKLCLWLTLFFMWKQSTTSKPRGAYVTNWKPCCLTQKLNLAPYCSAAPSPSWSSCYSVAHLCQIAGCSSRWNAFWLSILISSSHNPELLSVLYCCTNSCYTVFSCYHPFHWLLVLLEPAYSTNSHAHCNMCTAWTHPGIVWWPCTISRLC